MTRNARIALILAAVAVAAAAAIVIGTGGDDDEDAPTTSAATAPTTGATTATTPAEPRPKPIPTIRLRGVQPVGGVRTLEFRSGRRVRFAVASDIEQEVHVHGYDLTKTVPAGGRAVISFRAQAQGIFDVESHTTEEPVAKLKIVP